MKKQFGILSYQKKLTLRSFIQSVSLLVLFSVIFLPQLSMAQGNGTKVLLDKYSGKDGFTSIEIKKDLFELFAEIDEAAEEADEVREAMSKLTSINVLMFEPEDKDNKSLEAFRKELKGNIDLTGYIELMVIKEKDEEVKFLINKKNGKINELLLLIDQADEAGFVSILGDIDMKTISKLSKSMQIKGMENLQKIEEKESK